VAQAIVMALKLLLALIAVMWSGTPALLVMEMTLPQGAPLPRT
jgi:hypothetical protein